MVRQTPHSDQDELDRTVVICKDGVRKMEDFLTLTPEGTLPRLPEGAYIAQYPTSIEPSGHMKFSRLIDDQKK